MNYKNLIDVSVWNLDPINDGSHGEGMLEKRILISPEGKKYLYKKWWSRVKKGYKKDCEAQLSCEYINFRLAREILDIDVPKTFLALNDSSKFHSFSYGVLSEWFQNSDQDYVKGSEFMQKYLESLDRLYDDKGQNLEDIFSACEQNNVHNFREWWIDTLIFDFIIGNTDRHHDNWGLLNNPVAGYKLSPLFDNGASYDFREWEKPSITEYNHDKSIRKYKSKNSTTSKETNRDFLSIINYLKAKFSDLVLIKLQHFIDKLDDSERVYNLITETQKLSQKLPNEFHLSNQVLEHISNFIKSRVDELKVIIDKDACIK